MIIRINKHFGFFLAMNIYMREYPCQLTLVPVKVPFQIVFPTYVALWRCMGGVNAIGTALECAANKEETLRVSIQFFHPLRFSHVLMTNHTKCSPKCPKNLKQACSTTTHKFDDNTCECNCRDDYDQCGPGMVCGFESVVVIQSNIAKIVVRTAIILNWYIICELFILYIWAFCEDEAEADKAIEGGEDVGVMRM